MSRLRIEDLPHSRTLDSAAMASICGAGNGGGGGWVVGWIAPYLGATAGSLATGTDQGNVFNISNTFYVQVINAAQANFQNQTTDVFNSGNGATIDLGASQGSAIMRH